MKLKYPINLHKGMTGLTVLGMMLFYDNFNTAAWVYLAMHGSYGLLWIMKDSMFPDRQWEEPISIAYAVVVFLSLGLYWIAPWLLIALKGEPSGPVVGAAVALNAMGLMLHYASDAQKYFTLKYHPGLITDGLFSRCRNTNYLGELMIYAAFALMADHWAGFIGIGLFFTFVFIPNMIKKDKSLSRYEGFDAYKRRSGWLLPYW